MDAYMNMVASNFLHKATQATINKTLKTSAEVNEGWREERRVGLNGGQKEVNKGKKVGGGREVGGEAMSAYEREDS